MCNRRIMELAAKAAGYKTFEWLDDHRVWCSDGARTFLWCPRIDDGDSFRLAVKLRLILTIREDGYEARADAYQGHHYTVICGSDKAAAMREAIFQCSAAIAE